MIGLKKLKFFDWAAALISLLFVLAGSIVSIGRFWQYETFYYDFGIYDNAIWKVAHFRLPIVDHFIVGGKLIFADHFAPAIFLLSPLYWFTSRSEALLIVQALCVGLSGLVIYLTAKEILKSKPESFAVMVSYFLFLGLQNAVISDFHELTIATLPLSLVFYSIIKKKLKLYIASFLLTILLKETLFIMCAILGFFIIFFNKKWLKVGIATILFSLIYGFFVIKILIPYFSSGIYVYGETLNFNPFYVLKTLVDNPIKLNTIFYSLFSFGFLPLFAPQFWLLIFQDFLVRFYAPGATRITLGLHYSAPLSVILAVSSAYGLRNIGRFILKDLYKAVPVVVVLISIFLYRFILHGPFALSYNGDFYKHTKDFEFLNQLIEKVPKNSIVMAQNNLAPHFLHVEKETYLLNAYYSQIKPMYIIFDMREGQSPNDFFNIETTGAQRMLDSLRIDKCYKIFYSTKEQFIFNRICS